MAGLSCQRKQYLHGRARQGQAGGSTLGARCAGPRVPSIMERVGRGPGALTRWAWVGAAPQGSAWLTPGCERAHHRRGCRRGAGPIAQRPPLAVAAVLALRQRQADVHALHHHHTAAIGEAQGQGRYQSRQAGDCRPGAWAARRVGTKTEGAGAACQAPGCPTALPAFS